MTNTDIGVLGIQRISGYMEDRFWNMRKKLRIYVNVWQLTTECEEK